MDRGTGGSVLATMWYLTPLQEYKTTKPYVINVPQSAVPGGKQTNKASKPYHGCVMTDMRPSLGSFSLDKNGFEVLHGMTSTLATSESYDNTDRVRDIYCEEVADRLREFLGAELALTLGHSVRRRDPSFPSKPRGDKESKNTQPIPGVHVDYTPAWAFKNACMALGEDMATEAFNSRRVQIINTWRPLFGPLHDWPLGLLDYTSLDPANDLVATDSVYPHIVSETYNVLHNDKHKWYYLSEQQPSEMFLFKSFDNLFGAEEGTASVCVHGAFDNPLCPPGARPRESVECLVMVVYPESK
ncbi:hypothetical protein B0T17DRAFT_261280 [Bombardia bombarda]|uniref:Methyltransferase n=1 Tax=Bombardia bombarda TaxID=252184 RepID=A0AA39X0P9_9PEZI|nr:hypothetical protein B0T17DRAFT_261280 [Bombardia bombarda]